MSNGDPETVEAVKNGKKTINQACTEIRKKRNANKSAKNSETQRTKAPVVKPDQADSLSESPNESVAVPIPVGFHTVLEELGSVEYHVKRAIALYITISEEQRRKLLGETSEKNEQLKDDEDEYVDEEYEDEYDDEEAS